jgi:hypothetical protein
MQIKKKLNILVFFAKYNYNDQTKEDEMVRACNTYKEKNACRVLVRKRRDH